MRLKYTILTLLAVSGLLSCEKKMDLPAQPNSRILEYKVPVSDGTIGGIIDESDKTITVYLPFFYNLDVIDPEIKLADGAKLSEESLPVEVMGSNVSYTVTGRDKTTTTYKLVIKIQQIGPLVVNEVSTATANVNWGIGFYQINLVGTFNTTDPNKVRVFLVDANQKESEMGHVTGFGTAALTVQFGTAGKNYSMGYLAVPQTLDPGNYTIRVKVLSLSTDLKYPVTLGYMLPQVDYVAITAKQGDTFKIKTTGPIFHDFKSFGVMVNGSRVEFPIVSYTRTEATIRVPETMTPGTYAYGTAATLIFGDFTYTANWPITILAK